MKKKILMGLFCVVLLFGLTTGCEKKINKEDYVSKNLEETLTEEEIEHDLSNYKENDKQATIYMFRGHGCGYCKKFLTFINSIVDEYGEFFKLETYEVWSDDKNAKLMEQIGETLDTDVSGVPFIVIGDQYFTGYSERYDDSIKDAITKLYNSKEKYDVFEELEKKLQEEENEKNKDKVLSITINAIVVVLASALIIVINNKNTKLLQEKIENMSKEIKMLKEEKKEPKEIKENKDSKNQKNKTKK